MYAIEENYAKRRLVLLLGQYKDHDRAQFQQDMKVAALNVKGRHDSFDILADFSNSMVMPRDVADDSEDIAAWLIANGLRRSANISQSVTQQMQIRRVTKQNDRFAMFATREEGERWLDR